MKRTSRVNHHLVFVAGKSLYKCTYEEAEQGTYANSRKHPVTCFACLTLSKKAQQNMLYYYLTSTLQ